MSFYVPDAPLEPTEEVARIAFHCEICDEPIYEGDDYYDLRPLDHGMCCTTCVEDMKCHDAEGDDGSDAAYEAMREELMLNGE